MPTKTKDLTHDQLLDDLDERDTNLNGQVAARELKQVRPSERCSTPSPLGIGCTFKADASWNPLRGLAPSRHVCQKISPGCDHCYASTQVRRFGGQEYRYNTVGAVRLDEKALNLPMTWREPRRVFVCSMTDLFGEWVPILWIGRILTVMAEAPQHQFQVLTKRPQRMLQVLRTYYQAVMELKDPLPNVWIGTSIELDRFVWRAEYVRQCPAAVRFISAEPLLGPLPSLSLHGIDWLITGGESGAGHRPMEADWARDLRDRCQAEGIAFFHKQNGGFTHAAGGRLLDGRTWDEFPAVDEHARKNRETVARLQAAAR